MLVLRAGWALVFAACAGALAQAPVPLRPVGIAYDSAGDLFFADAARHQVYESTVGGSLVVVAGTGVQGFGGDGGLATSAVLNRPAAVAVGPDGTLYIADTGNERVRAVGSDGVMRTVAGNGVRGFSGDGGAATAAELDEPAGIAVDATGNVVIADAGNQRVRRVVAGVIATIAGNGVEGFAGDGGAATAAELDTPVAVACADGGRVLVADAHNHRVRVIATDGTIATFAGTGVRGFSGDGGTALAAELFSPRGVAVLPDGSVLIADANNRRVRLVDASGTIRTVAGDGVQGGSSDGVTATAASLNDPRAVTASGFGSAVFADTSARMVRALLGNGSLYAAAGMAPVRTSVVTATVPASVVYGSGSVQVGVTGQAGVPLGAVALEDNGSAGGAEDLVQGSAGFSLSALPVGAHAVVVRYAGDGFNPAADSAATAMTVVRAATSTSASAASAYAGMPMTLTATVAPQYAGMPTGAVSFEDNGSAVVTAALVNGVATGVYLAPPEGTHSIVAKYPGDANFLASQSQPAAATVAALPDFSIAVDGSTSQTVQAGTTAVFSIRLAAQSAAFSSSVSLSMSGLPAGTAVTFSPPQVVPGTAGATVTMSVPTLGLLAMRGKGRGMLWWALLLPVGFGLWRRRRAAALVVLVALAGCGPRTVTDAAAVSKSYTVHVTGTATSLAGSLLTHAADVTLTVE